MNYCKSAKCCKCKCSCGGATGEELSFCLIIRYVISHEKQLIIIQQMNHLLLKSYLRLIVDVGVHVQTLRVEDDDVSFPDGC